jgi:microcystin-dependent protein
MSSPVTGDDFTIASMGQSFCERMTNLLSLSSKMKLFFDWMFDSSGDPTQSAKAMFMLPPGVMVPYYTLASYDAAVQQVLRLDRTDEDIAENGLEPSAAFWVLCNGENGTPDLRGRVMVGAGQGTGLTNRPVGAVGGLENVELVKEELPDMASLLSDVKFNIAISNDSDPAHDPINEVDWGFSGDTGGGGDSGEVSYSSASNRIRVAASGEQDTTAAGHENMQPYSAVYFIMRTQRTA